MILRIQMGSDVRHFNASLIVQGKVAGQSIIHICFEEKGKAKRGFEHTSFRLPYQPSSYHQAKPAHAVIRVISLVF